MASKKNLSDLLREEVKKTPQSDVPAPTATPAQPSSETASTAAATPQITIPKNLSRLTKAELEKKIHQLVEALQASQEKEVTLQGQVSDLTATVADQKETLQALQSELTQAQALQTELEQVRSDAVKLAQENERLQAQIESAKQDRQKQGSAKQGTVNLKAPAKKSARTPVTRTPVRREAPARRERTIFDRPVVPSHKPNQTGRASKNFDTWCYD